MVQIPFTNKIMLNIKYKNSYKSKIKVQWITIKTAKNRKRYINQSRDQLYLKTVPYDIEQYKAFLFRSRLRDSIKRLKSIRNTVKHGIQFENVPIRTIMLTIQFKDIRVQSKYAITYFSLIVIEWPV